MLLLSSSRPSLLPRPLAHGGDDVNCYFGVAHGVPTETTILASALPRVDKSWPIVFSLASEEIPKFWPNFRQYLIEHNSGSNPTPATNKKMAKVSHFFVIKSIVDHSVRHLLPTECPRSWQWRHPTERRELLTTAVLEFTLDDEKWPR